MKKVLLIILALLVPPVASIVIARLVDRASLPRRFEEVVAARMYRGGFPTSDALRRLKEEKKVRAVVSLTADLDREKDRQLDADAKRLGLRHHRFAMPGDGRADYAIMDQAADAVANAENWPVYFHCAAGEQRSNAVHAAYRLKYCNWTIDMVQKELETNGLDTKDPKELLLWEHIKGYANWIRTMAPVPASAPALSRSPTTLPVSGESSAAH